MIIKISDIRILIVFGMLYFFYIALDGRNYGSRFVLLWSTNIIIFFKRKICINHKAITMFIDISVPSIEQKYQESNQESN